MSDPCTCDWSGACVPCRLARARETPAGAALLREGHEAGFTAAIRLFWQGVCEGLAVEHKQEAEKAWRQYERTSDPYWSREMVRQEARAAQYRAWAGEA